ncbi:hypothetical protein [Pseudomonas sp. BF-RE-29]|uniref:hypothetical protein n=1 Tax=Pseudomonas sp. BF-RE-29 TaxID=2832378 RepID=UPI001CBF995A|nr:hypothetical protein [Pseudomonas sp. BF-RE-29]
MNTDDAKLRLGIPFEHDLVQTETTWKAKGGQDTDTYWYDEVNVAGQVVGKYVLYDSTSTHPPFERTIDWQKL